MSWKLAAAALDHQNVYDLNIVPPASSWIGGQVCQSTLWFPLCCLHCPAGNPNCRDPSNKCFLMIKSVLWRRNAYFVLYSRKVTWENNSWNEEVGRAAGRFSNQKLNTGHLGKKQESWPHRTRCHVLGTVLFVFFGLLWRLLSYDSGLPVF